MPDRLVTAAASDGMISLVAGTTTELVREAQSRHELAPTASAAVGRLITGAALLGASLKGKERVTLQIAGDGAIGRVVADVVTLDDRAIGARAYAQNPAADVPLNARGKFDVARIVGSGQLQVTRSFEVGQPYNGVVPLVSGEIGEDLASYLVRSQQIPSVVALGVLANPTGIIAAGGLIAQVMPGADESTLERLEERARAMPPVTEQIVGGAGPEDLLVGFIGELGLKTFREVPISFACLCTRERVETALLGLGREELLKIAHEQQETEATCEFCKKRYVLASDEVRELVARTESSEAPG
jgi:molecular chaperone Hsp33